MLDLARRLKVIRWLFLAMYLFIIRSIVLGLVLAAPPKSEIEPHPVLIASKSTLIMCPEHISKQWHDEITRATNLSVLLVANYEDLKKCTYEDFRSQYDVIVCVYELFASLKYVCLPSRRTKGTLTEVERNNNVKTALEELRANQNFSEVKAPIIEHFFFHRVVFDEGHQSSKEFCLHRYAVIDLSKNVWGRSKWFVSATPFGSGNVFHFLCLPPLKNTIGYVNWKFFEIDLIWLTFFCRYYRAELIYRDYLWRNTKDSVKDEIAVPETVDDVHYVELSPIERAIYFNESYETTRDPYHACVTFTYHTGLKSVAAIRLANLKVHPELNVTPYLTFVLRTGTYSPPDPTSQCSWRTVACSPPGTRIGTKRIEKESAWKSSRILERQGWIQSKNSQYYAKRHWNSWTRGKQYIVLYLAEILRINALFLSQIPTLPEKVVRVSRPVAL